MVSATPTILDSDFKYIDKNGNLMKTRTELAIAQMLDFLDQDYQYNYELELTGGEYITISFKTNCMLAAAAIVIFLSLDCFV